MTSTDKNLAERREAMRLLARAKSEDLAAAVEEIGDHEAEDLKLPEVGLVMVRGRIGGDGAAFNVGEATVARSVVRLRTGLTGYGLRLGRDVSAARHAAILDAHWQWPGTRATVESTILAPTRRAIAAEQANAAAATASTRVEFFTMAREAS